ncbi:outer membrane beta-barrel protein [Gracilimonas sp. BCB1]|uniref:outer membrane beta-barrel protein n=1 Tax=Gracilimonas sp. BCB1 TaxID=3152362 RepID=UPI0032D98517
MRKLSFLILALAFSLSLNTNASAQEAENAYGDIQIGAGLMYGSEIEQPGLRLDGTYRINEDFRAVAELGFYLPDDAGNADVNWFEFNINGNYIFVNDPEQGLIAYALAGLNYTRVKVSSGNFSSDNGEVGLNVGAGAEYGLDFANLFGEFKYVLGDYDQLNIGVGLRFAIGN